MLAADLDATINRVADGVTNHWIHHCAVSGAHEDDSDSDSMTNRTEGADGTGP